MSVSPQMRDARAPERVVLLTVKITDDRIHADLDFWVVQTD
jgi:hypothetical protein